jgi:hypothetical protein
MHLPFTVTIELPTGRDLRRSRFWLLVGGIILVAVGGLLLGRTYRLRSADEPGAATTLRLPRRPGAGRGDETAEAAATAARQLAARCDDLTRQLGRCGLTTRRLGDGELAALHYACWCPDLARVQRLRRDLADYQGLVVARAATGFPPERS